MKLYLKLKRNEKKTLCGENGQANTNIVIKKCLNKNYYVAVWNKIIRKRD